MCSATYLPPSVFAIIIERWQQCLVLVCLVVLLMVADVLRRRRQYGRLTDDNSRDLVLTILAYVAVSAALVVVYFESFIWQDAFEQHETAALAACPFVPVSLYVTVGDVVVRDAGVLFIMLLSLAALFTILRGVTAALVAKRR